MSQNEKRKYNRVPSSFEVRVSFLDKKNNIDISRLNAESINISANGILFNYRENLKIGTFLLLSFFPISATCETIVEGQIVRCKKKKGDLYSIAVHFTIFQKGDESGLNEILKQAWI